MSDEFDPDAYLDKYGENNTPDIVDFDPDAYLAKYQEQKIPSDLRVAGQAAVRGITAVPDMFLNTPSNVWNLGKAAYGTAVTAAGRPDMAPEVSAPPNIVTRGYENLGLISPAGEPVTKGQEYLATGVSGAVGGALTGNPLTGATIGAGSSLVGKGVEEATGSQSAGIAASLLSGYGGAKAANAIGANARAAQAVEQQELNERALQLSKKTSIAKDAITSGYKIPPHLIEDNTTTQKVISTVGKKLDIESKASDNNYIKAQKVVQRYVGLPESTPISFENLETKRAELGKAYEKLKKQPDIKIDSEYAPNELSPKIDQKVDLNMTQRNHIKMADAVEHIKQLRADANKIDRNLNYDPSLDAKSRAFKSEANSLEDLIERNLKKTKKKSLLTGMQKARVGIAKTYSVEDGINKGTGMFDPKHASKLIHAVDGEKIQGELKKLGEYAAAYPDAFKKLEKATSHGVSRGDFGASIISGVGGSVLTGNPIGMLAGLVPTAAPYVARSYLLSDKYQQSMMPDYVAKSRLAGIPFSDPTRQAILPTVSSLNELMRQK